MTAAKMFLKSVVERKAPLKTIVYTCSHDTKKVLSKIMIVLMDLTKNVSKKSCSEVTQKKKNKKQIYVFINNLQKFQVD